MSQPGVEVPYGTLGLAVLETLETKGSLRRPRKLDPVAAIRHE